MKRAIAMAVIRRLLIVIAVAAPMVYAANVLYHRGPGSVAWLPECMFHRMTGWYCAGCGMTRASYSLMHFRVADALGYNPLGVILLPFVMLGIILEVVGWVSGRKDFFRMRIGARGALVLLTALLIFFVARNLPWWPCTLLAPHGTVHVHTGQSTLR